METLLAGTHKFDCDRPGGASSATSVCAAKTFAIPTGSNQPLDFFRVTASLLLAQVLIVHVPFTPLFHFKGRRTKLQKQFADKERRFDVLTTSPFSLVLSHILTETQ
jgi:hypothetical protein